MTNRVKKKYTYAYPHHVTPLEESERDGYGKYGIQVVEYKPSSAPGGYSVDERHYFFETVPGRKKELVNMRKHTKQSKKYGPFIEPFNMVNAYEYPTTFDWPLDATFVNGSGPYGIQSCSPCDFEPSIYAKIGSHYFFETEVERDKKLVVKRKENKERIYTPFEMIEVTNDHP